MKPPKNSELDPKVLARRQKDLDGFTDKYDAILDKRDAVYSKELQATYKRIGRNITNEINDIYKQLQDANGVPITKSPISPEKLRNMEAQIKRLGSLQAQLVKEMGTEEQLKKLERNLAYNYTDGYYFSAFALEQAAQVGVNVPLLTQAHVMGVLANPWLPDGKTYSDRLRANTNLLAAKMRDSLEEAVGNGWGWNRLARRIQDVAGEGYYNAVRLARTERTRAAGQGANHLYMQNADIMDGKRWNATLDRRTAPKDAANDGELYELAYDTPELPGRAGERIPNHPNCRCKWSPLLSSLGVSSRERIARNADGSRTYTKARNYKDYAKEKGLPDLDERLANEDPRKYLRRGETMDAYNVTSGKLKQATETAAAAATGAAVAEGTLAEKVQERIQKGVNGEADAREVGAMLREEIESGTGEEAERLAKEVETLKKKNNDLANRYDSIKRKLRSVKDLVARQPLYDEADQVLQEWRSTYAALKTEKQALADLRASKAREVLQQVRPLGNPGKHPWAKGSQKKVKDAIEQASAFYPSDWLRVSNQGREMIGRKVRRGHYWEGNRYEPAEMYLSGKDEQAMLKVAVHELGHRMEDMIPELRKLEYEFYQRRTAGEGLKWLGPGYSKREKTRFDDFLAPYMGKDYGNKEDSFYEIFTMGMESIFNASYDIAKDKDYYDFILGVLASK